MPALDPSLLELADQQLSAIIVAAPMLPLDDAGVDQATAAAIDSWLRSRPAISPCCLAGLWLLAGDLDRSHTISQQVETIDGSYWHGIMHRREGDYFNAKYWMRRTSGHPVTAALQRQASEYRDAMSFVDYVEQAMRQSRLKVSAEQIQWLEWQLLFAHCQ